MVTFLFLKNPSKIRLFSVLRPISDAPGTGLFAFMRFSEGLGKKLGSLECWAGSLDLWVSSLEY